MLRLPEQRKVILFCIINILEKCAEKIMKTAMYPIIFILYKNYNVLKKSLKHTPICKCSPILFHFNFVYGYGGYAHINAGVLWCLRPPLKVELQPALLPDHLGPCLQNTSKAQENSNPPSLQFQYFETGHFFHMYVAFQTYYTWDFFSWHHNTRRIIPTPCLGL